MKKLLIFLLLSPFLVQAQEKISRFVNQTELSILMGRSIEGLQYYPYYYSSSSIWPGPSTPNVSTKKRNTGSFSIQTFNGWRIKPKTTVGLTTGLDAYQGALIVPVAAGVRQIVIDKGEKSSKIQASLDAGVGTMWLDDQDGASKEGGLMVNPAVGFIFPTRSGSAFLINFGYKYQRYSLSNTVEGSSYSQESRNIKRFQLRFGFQF